MPSLRTVLTLAVLAWGSCAGPRGHVSLLNVITELKKACNHPFLFESAEDEYRCGNPCSLPGSLLNR